MRVCFCIRFILDKFVKNKFDKKCRVWYNCLVLVLMNYYNFLLVEKEEKLWEVI